MQARVCGGHSGMWVIDKASPEDIPALCELLSVLFEQEQEFVPDADAQRAGLLAILDDPKTGIILVAREGRRILAMVNLLFTVSTALGGRVALLEDMVVTPMVRGAGVGSALLRRAVALAHDAGCRRITLLTDADNVRAQRFYQQHGFVPSAMLPMRLLLR